MVMSDLIYRQAAIELLLKWADGYSYIETPTDAAVEEFRKLPSAEPETEERMPKTEQNVSEADVIFRKDAIEAMSESLKRVFPKHRQIAEKCLNALPSAEPRMKGKWIRGGAYPHHIFCSVCYATYIPNDEWVIWKTDGTDGYRLPRSFCPNCGADMRGEEDGD